MDLRAELAQVAEGRERRTLYPALLAATVYVRQPAHAPAALTRPDTGERAVPAFVTAADAARFWAEVSGGRPVAVEPVAFAALAAAARGVGRVVLDPAGAGVVLDRAELGALAVGEVPGELTDWLRQVGRLGRSSAEVTARLRKVHVHVLTTRNEPGQEPRLYLLEKSEDGTLAVPCFSSAQTLAQFAQVRRLAEQGGQQAVALVTGEHCLRVAAGMGAYVLFDPESPWETQIEPPLITG
jgi:hypothetical protein